MKLVAFSPEYVRLVLNENFEDAKALFLSPLLAIHAAHLVMLNEQGIIPLAAAPYDESREDLFFYCERLIVAACGEDVAGRLHTARSRNDIDMTMYRMRLREYVLVLTDATLGLRASLIEIASEHRETLFAAHHQLRRHFQWNAGAPISAHLPGVEVITTGAEGDPRVTFVATLGGHASRARLGGWRRHVVANRNCPSHGDTRAAAIGEKSQGRLRAHLRLAHHVRENLDR